MRHWTDHLSDYLDDALAPADRHAIEAHLAICAECASTLDELRHVVASAQRLESRAPEGDLWPAIAARLEPRRAPLRERIGVWFGARRFSFTFPQLAAATAAVALVAVGMAWVGFERQAGQVATLRPTTPAGVSSPGPDLGPEPAPAGERSDAPRREPAAAGATPPVESSLAAFDASRYDAAAAELRQVLDRHRADLDTSTVRILEQNLAIIDRALLEARRALEVDPANPYLNNHLAEQMKRKIRLLQTAAAVVAAHS